MSYGGPKSKSQSIVEAISRRDALRFGVGISVTAMPGSGCGIGPNRCAAGPQESPTANTEAALRLSAIDNIVVVMMENRSFDHLFGSLREDPQYPDRARLDGLLGGEMNLDAQGRPVFVKRMPGNGAGSFNPKHDAVSAAKCFAQGTNNAFAIVNEGPFVSEVMSRLERDQVPFFYSLADNFTICDRWFSSTMGPTWPNRFFLHATTAAGRHVNHPMGFGGPSTVWDRMAERCYTTKNYGAGPVLWYTAGFPLRAMSGNDSLTSATIEEFFSDARAGQLPSFSVIDPNFKINDGYPQHDLSLAEGFVASIYRAMSESPQWARSLLVITFDEHGGYFDHVVPPRTVDPHSDFQQLGFRVPALVIGPSVWQGRVVNTQFEHSSVAATLKTRFGIRDLGPRMAATNDLSSCIDPVRLLSTSPPPRLEAVSLGPNFRAQDVANRPTSQSEIDLALTAKDVPASHVDPRTEDERFTSWLRLAQELEAVKVVR
jgi:phospholipase C